MTDDNLPTVYIPDDVVVPFPGQVQANCTPAVFKPEAEQLEAFMDLLNGIREAQGRPAVDMSGAAKQLMRLVLKPLRD